MRNRKILYSLLFNIVSLLAFGQTSHVFNGAYNENHLSRVAFPIGGLGAGMFCLEGTGTVSHLSIRNYPEVFNEPVMFASLYIKGKGAKVLEGPVPNWKKFGQHDNARGGQGSDYGLARFRGATFTARFPFAEIKLQDKDDSPVRCSLTGWSPFIPGDADNSGLPVGALEYHFTNTSKQVQNAVFSYCAADNLQRVEATPGGFILAQGSSLKAESTGSLAIFCGDPNTTVDNCWYRGDWFDPLSMAWKKINEGRTNAVPAIPKGAPGASLYIPFTLKSGESRTIIVYICWYFPYSGIRTRMEPNQKSDTTVAVRDKDQPSKYYMPWYANRFKDIEEVMAYWKTNYPELKRKTRLFTTAFYKSTLPPEVIETMAANLSILKSPTVLRQYDGRFWGWEGSNDNSGSCQGTCTHVYNYAQALCHLFPALQRSIDETALGEGLNADGHQNYREALPIRPENHNDFAAADGQLGGVMQLYRDWRISGDDAWLKNLYPKVKRSLDYCIRTWDPDHRGLLTEPHHNTYDIEFWGADGMCTSMYLGALEAFILMSDHLDEKNCSNCIGKVIKYNPDLIFYEDLFDKGKKAMETQLYNGEYFNQHIQWTGLHQEPKTEGFSPEAKALFDQEGPQYQYGNGCLSDGVIGSWIANVCGLPAPVDESKVKSHLNAIYKYNFKTDLTRYSNPQRPTFALGKEGGLLLCSWPKGGALSLPFVYSNEVWTGIEYEVASHLILEGKVKEGLNIVRTARKRYDGTIRNPFDEYECGHWYMRAMSSYALLQALTGVSYDAVTKTLYVHSQIGDFTSFLSTDTGFGNVIYKNGKATLKVVYGKIEVNETNIQTNKL